MPYWYGDEGDVTLADAAEQTRGARARTRRAILDAAISVLSRNPAASLAEVAEAAQVGRTTVHRYFPERSDLLDAVSADVLARIDAAVRRARPGEGSGRAALLRVCRELFDLGDLLTLVLSGQLSKRPEWQECTDADSALIALIQRGQADGSIEPDLTPEWLQRLLWSLLSAADAHGRDNAKSRHDALALALRSIDGAIRPG
ncbi:MAG: TetR/AcrR family transcriptional regulator [Actinomycetota bacterium]|nr:TetR/AcrR family transcriptional regulator [Actinomycetota bacterium]